MTLKVKGPAVVLFSGGLDSTVVLARALEAGHCKVYPLFFSYGQRNIIEHDKALSLLASAPARVAILKSVTIEAYCQLVPKHPYLRYDTPVETLLNGGVALPNRLMVFVSLAAVYAFRVKATSIYIGVQNEPGSAEGRVHDTSQGLVDALEWVLRGSVAEGYPYMKLRAPLVDMSKAQILAEARERGIRVEDTYSCHLGKLTPCGKCSSCQSIYRVTRGA